MYFEGHFDVNALFFFSMMFCPGTLNFVVVVDVLVWSLILMLLVVI